MPNYPLRRNECSPPYRLRRMAYSRARDRRYRQGGRLCLAGWAHNFIYRDVRTALRCVPRARAAAAGRRRVHRAHKPIEASHPTLRIRRRRRFHWQKTAVAYNP